MKAFLPRKRTLLLIHRWLGVVSAIFLVIVSITGLILNHTETLGLNNVRVSTDWIMERYGMASGQDIDTFRIQESTTISHIDGQLYLNAEPFLSTMAPVGILKEEALTVVATTDAIILLTPDNQLVEEIEASRLPYSRLVSVGRDSQGQPVLESEKGLWQPDSAWVEFEAFEGSFAPQPMTPADLNTPSEEAILAHYQGEGMTLYRVLLDLHSGRLFGWGGRTLMDLSAVAILLLVSSGMGGWMRQSRRRFRIG